MLEKTRRYFTELVGAVFEGQRIDCRRIIATNEDNDGGVHSFIFLPSEVTLCCPNCGEPAEPKGKSHLIFDYSVSVQLLVVCDQCGCTHRPPIPEEVMEKNKGALLLRAYELQI